MVILSSGRMSPGIEMIVILNEAKDLTRSTAAIQVIWLLRAHRYKRFSRVTENGSPITEY